MASKQLFEIEKFLECVLCQREGNDPRILPCLHSLCKPCTDKHLETQGVDPAKPSSTFACPSCGHECELPAGGSEVLPKNLMLKELRKLFLTDPEHKTELLASSTEALDAASDKVCSNQDKGDVAHSAATVFCVDCAQFYCSTCESFHKMFDMSSGHKLLPVDDVDNSELIAAEEARMKQPTRCEQHKEQVINMFCDTCSIQVCTKCCLTTHQRHKYRELDHKTEDSKSRLGAMKRAATKLINTLDNRLKKLEESERLAETRGNEACEEIGKAAEELRKAVARREQSLIKRTSESLKTGLEQIRSALTDTNLQKACVENLLLYIHALQETEDSTTQLAHTPGLQEQLRRQKTVPQQLVTWTVNLKKEAESSMSGSLLGDVNTSKTKMRGSGDVREDEKMHLSSPMSSFQPRVGNYVSGLAVVGDCLCVVGSWEPYLWVHNMKTNQSKQHKLDGLRAQGLAVVHDDENNDVLVIVDSNKKLYFITISHRSLNITNQFIKDLPFQPRRASVDPLTGKLVIANITDKQVATCDNKGAVEKVVTVNTSIGHIWCALATDGGFIVLDRSTPGKVHWLNEEGDVALTYGDGRGEVLKDPEHLIMDSQHRLVIADYNNHRLHLLDGNRQFSHCLLSQEDDIKRPTCLLLDETSGSLFVAHRKTNNINAVSVYTWPFASTSDIRHVLNLELKKYT